MSIPARSRTVLACALAALSAGGLLGVTAASAHGGASTGTPAQIAWVRRAAGNFLAAELARDGAGACAVLNAPLRATRHGVSCQARWDARIAAMLASRGERATLARLHRDAASATVAVSGGWATIDLPGSLLGGGRANRFRWSESCWMLAG